MKCEYTAFITEGGEIIDKLVIGYCNLIEGYVYGSLYKAIPKVVHELELLCKDLGEEIEINNELLERVMNMEWEDDYMVSVSKFTFLNFLRNHFGRYLLFRCIH